MSIVRARVSFSNIDSYRILREVLSLITSLARFSVAAIPLRRLGAEHSAARPLSVLPCSPGDGAREPGTWFSLLLNFYTLLAFTERLVRNLYRPESSLITDDVEPYESQSLNLNVFRPQRNPDTKLCVSNGESLLTWKEKINVISYLIAILRVQTNDAALEIKGATIH